MARATPSVENFDHERKEKFYADLQKWYDTSEKAAVLREQEMELRKALVTEYMPDAKEGTNTLGLGFGKVLKVTVPVTRAVDDAQLDALKKVAAAEGRVSVLALCDVIFNYRPSLAVGEWKDLTDDERKLFADVVTEKPGAPGVKIETPKR